MSANTASRVGVETGAGRFILRDGFRIRFHGEALHGLQRRGNRLLVGLGSPHFWIKTLINLAQGGIVRANGGHCTVGILRSSYAGWLAEFVVSISVHNSGRPVA